MADNYLEKRYDEYLSRREAERKARQRAWKKRLDAYRKKLASGQSIQGRSQSAHMSSGDSEH